MEEVSEEVSAQNFRHHFTVFQPVAIQNYDVLFVLVLHFCTGVTLELHCSHPVRIDFFFHFYYGYFIDKIENLLYWNVCANQLGGF